jgi:hypothetical protein
MAYFLSPARYLLYWLIEPEISGLRNNTLLTRLQGESRWFFRQ